MRVELLPGMKNVLRFPIQRRARPTLDLLREIAPDVREVLNMAEAFGMEPPAHGLREQVDAATAEHIADQVPTSGPGRAAMLTGLLDPVIVAAVAACRASHDAWLERPRHSRRCYVRNRATFLDGAAAGAGGGPDETRRGRLLVAHVRVEEAESVARAVGIARRGEEWMPRDGRAEADALFGFAATG